MLAGRFSINFRRRLCGTESNRSKKKKFSRSLLSRKLFPVMVFHPRRNHKKRNQQEYSGKNENPSSDRHFFYLPADAPQQTFTGDQEKKIIEKFFYKNFLGIRSKKTPQRRTPPMPLTICQPRLPIADLRGKDRKQKQQQHKSTPLNGCLSCQETPQQRFPWSFRLQTAFFYAVSCIVCHHALFPGYAVTVHLPVHLRQQTAEQTLLLSPQKISYFFNRFSIEKSFEKASQAPGREPA